MGHLHYLQLAKQQAQPATVGLDGPEVFCMGENVPIAAAARMATARSGTLELGGRGKGGGAEHR